MADNKVQVIISALDQTGAALQSAENGLNKIQNVAHAVAGALAAIGALEAVATFVELGKAAFDNADALDKMAQKTGMSVEFLSKLQYGAKLADVDLESLGQGVAKFDKAIVGAMQGNAKYLGTFQSLGITLKDLKSKSPEQVLLQLMQRFSETADSATKTNAATILFGRSGQNLIPILNAGKAGFDEISAAAQRTGNVLDSEAASKAAKLHDKIEQLQAKAEGAATQFMVGLVPAIDAVASSLDRASDSADGFWEHMGKTVGMKSAGMFLGLQASLKGLELSRTSDPAERAKIQAEIQALYKEYDDMIAQYAPKKLDTSLVPAHGPGIGSFKSQAGKPEIPVPSSDDTEKRAKARIDLEKAMADQSAMIAAETTKANLAALELEKDQGLITLADYWAQRRKITIDGAQAELDALTKKWEDEDKRVQAMPDGTAKTEAKAALLKTQDAVLKKEFEIAAADDQLTAQQIANAQQLADNVTAIQAEINAAKNNSAEVAIAAIHREFDEKRRLMAAAGKDTSGLDEVERMRVAAAEAEIVRRQIDLMYSEMSRKISDIQAKVANRALSEIQAEKDILTVKHQTSVQLDELIAKYQALAAASNDASLIESGRQIHQQNQQLGEDIGETDRALQDSMVNGWSNYFGTILSEGPKAAGGFKGFINSVLGDLDRLIAKMIVVWAWQKILGWISGAAMSGGAADAAGGASVGAAGSAGGGVLGSIDPSMPIGGHAEGGPMAAGEVSWVGERGKELWIPDSSGIVVPNSVFSGGGGRVLGGDQLGGGVGQMSIALSVTSDVDLKIAAASAEWSSKTLRQAVNIVPNVVREQRLRGQR